MIGLDDVGYVPEPIYTLLGSECFSIKGAAILNINAIQKLRMASWRFRYMFGACDDADIEVRWRLTNDMGFSLPAGVVHVDQVLANGLIKESVRQIPFVFAPRFCESVGITPTYRPPRSVDELLAVVEFFCNSGEPFLLENYKRFLNQL